MAFLPGDIGQRIKELREQRDIKQEKLAEILNINKATLSRIERGETKTVGSDILMALAEHFNVSVDFLVGFTCVPDPKNYSVEALGLSSDGAKAMISRKVHMEIVNRLLENPEFCQLTYTMHYALEPNQMAAVSSANNMLVFGDSLMVGVMNQSVKGNQELLALSRRLGAEMIDPNTIGNYKMEDEFRKIIAQLRRDIRREKPVSVPLTREFLEEADRELLQRAGGVRENVNPRMVAEIICEKMLVDRICTPEQKERFIAVFADILSNGGGEEDGKAIQ
jgi:transcriptional regulator with XRE-family HTH domain